MSDYHYDDNLPKTLARRSRIKLGLMALFLIILLLVGFILIDSLRSDSQITRQEPDSSTLGSQVERQVFNYPEFRFTTDTTWQEIPALDTDHKNYRFQSQSDGLVKRQLTIYVNSVPEEFPISHVLPVETNNNRITPLAVSPKCSELQTDKTNRRDIQLTWAGVSFLCDPDSGLVEVGTAHNKTGYGLKISGPSGRTHTFFFVFRDDEPSPRLNIFSELLETFEAK